MRPLELELEGFTSFRNRTTIPLGDIDLFAITGFTGSGKTSVIDAMILALYGRTPRLKEVSQLVARGLKHMRVRLDFAVGERRYRVARSWKVLPKSMQNQAVLEEIQNGLSKNIAGKSGDVGEAVAQIIGLDFDSFIRSVVLPQGEFDLFLKGEPKERQKILHHLFLMHVYDRARELALERAESCRQELRHLDLRLEELAGATEEALAESRESAARVAAGLEVVVLVLGRAEHAAKQAAALVQELGKAEEAGAEANRLAAESEAAQANLKAIAERDALAERARAALEAELARSPYDESRHLALEKSEAEARNLREAESARTRAAAENEAAKKEIARLEKALAAVQEDMKREENESAGAAKAAKATLTTRDELARKFSSPAQVAAHRAHEENRLQTLAERERKEEAMAAAVVEQVTEALAEARKAEAKAQATREEKGAAFEAAQRAGAALALRQHLHRGDPCPVCEQTVAKLPLKRKLTGLDQARAAFEQAGTHAQACMQETTRLGARLEAERGRQRDLEREVKRLRAAEDACAAKLETYLGGAPDANTARRLAQAQADFERAEKAVQASTEKQQTAERRLEAARKRRDAGMAQITAEKHAAAVRDRHVAEADRAIAAMGARISGVVGEGPDPVAALESALAASRRAKTEQEEIARKIEGEVERLAAAREEAAVLRASMGAVEKKRAHCAQAAEAAARRAAKVRDLLIQAAREIEISLPESETGDKEEGAIARRLAELRERQLTLAREQALAVDRAGQIAAGVAKRGELARQSDHVVRKERIAGALAEDLKSNRFVEYLLEEALQVLAADANTHLRTFPVASFSLAAVGQDFLVIDHANADERRSVRTLSGGESFCASLALAIALAENVAELAERTGGRAAVLDSLFLDEGFGTLDAENLDAVAGAIEALQVNSERGRTVGIITHLPELAQRMPARIVVTKQGNSSQVLVESG